MPRCAVKNAQKKVTDLQAILASTSLPAQEKIAAALERYQQAIEDNRVNVRETIILKRERDEYKSDADRSSRIASDAKSRSHKLEQLVNLITEQKKALEAENRTMKEDDIAKRQELSKRFEEQLGGISERLNDQSGVQVAQAEENSKLREQLTKLLEQYDTREKYFEHQLKAQKLETQLAEAKHAQSTEVAKKLEELALERTKELRSEKLKTEVLSEELGKMESQFKKFNEAITNSQKQFDKFKADSSKHAATVQKLETENARMKKRVKEMEERERKAIDERKKAEKNASAMEALARKLRESATVAE